MDKFFKSHRMILALLIVLMVVGLFAGCTANTSDNTTGSTVGSTADPSDPQATTDPTTATTNPTTATTDPTTATVEPTTESTTTPTTEPTTAPTTNPTTNTQTTTPSVTFTDVNETVYATSTVNVRSGPGADYTKLGSLSSGNSVTRTGIGSNGWSKVIYDGKEAYISSSYLSKEKVETPSTNTGSSGNNTGSSGTIAREPLPSGVVCGYDWLECIARAATEDELRAFQKEKGYADDMIWCEHCGRPVYAMSVDGQLLVCGAIYGTCMRHFSGGDWTCKCCGATIPVNTCHTCGVPVEVTPLPGTTVNSPSQLTAAHKEYLRDYAKAVSEGLYGGKDNETFVSIYAFVLTDNTAISSKSKCVCFFVFTSEKAYSETPVYHTGEFYDIAIMDDGSLTFGAKAEEFTYYKDEASAAASYEKIGHSITKIS